MEKCAAGKTLFQSRGLAYRNGWNESYEMGDDDWAELKRKGIIGKYTGLLGEAKENVQTLINANRQDLIGKPAR